MGQLDGAAALFATKFLITGSYGTRLGHTAELFPGPVREPPLGR
jgi:hypothetical protein